MKRRSIKISYEAVTNILHLASKNIPLPDDLKINSIKSSNKARYIELEAESKIYEEIPEGTEPLTEELLAKDFLAQKRDKRKGLTLKRPIKF